MLPFWMAVVSTHRLGLDSEYDPSDKLFCILQPWSIYTGCISLINRFVRDTMVALLILKLKSVDPVGGSNILVNLLLAVVEPDVVIEPNDRAVVDVIEACFPDNDELI